MEKVELEFGAFGTVYYDGDGRVLGSMQYGPAPSFPRAYELPGGPPSNDAMLVTCAYLVERVEPVGAAVALPRGDRRGARPRHARLEAFAYRYSEGESAYERFRVHRTVFPHDFLADFGFQVAARRRPGRAVAPRARRAAARVEGTRERSSRRRQGRLRVPAPVPAPRAADRALQRAER